MADVSSSYILGDTHIWLIVHLDPDANVTAVEDHDHHSGGHIEPRRNESYEQLFTNAAQRRGFTPDVIREFLNNSKERTRRLNPNRPANIAFMLDRIPVEHLKAALARRPNE